MKNSFIGLVFLFLTSCSSVQGSMSSIDNSHFIALSEQGIELNFLSASVKEVRKTSLSNPYYTHSIIYKVRITNTSESTQTIGNKDIAKVYAYKNETKINPITSSIFFPSTYQENLIRSNNDFLGSNESVIVNLDIPLTKDEPFQEFGSYFIKIQSTSVFLYNESEFFKVNITSDFKVNKLTTFSILFFSEDNQKVSILKYESNEVIQLPELTRTGHRFLGWYTDSNFINKFTTNLMPNNDLILYAGWEVKTYRITFEENGGTTVNDLNIEFGKIINLPTSYKSGYTLKGWYTTSNLITEFKLSVMPDRNFTLYARWMTSN
jgi:uncharacterized repeat protein (TIGR02543 family)